MGKRKRRQSNRKQPPKKPEVMTQHKVSEVTTWLKRMEDNIEKAVELSQQLTLDALTEDNPLFWALVKLAENAQESAKKIDKINRKLFSELIEFDQSEWKALRGMRDRLAHKFWDIDPNILWETVSVNFVQLLPLLATMYVYQHPVGQSGEISLTVKPETILGLPDWKPGTSAKAGHSLVMVAFTKTGDVMVNRYGHDGTNRLTIGANSSGRLIVSGLPKHPR